MRTATAIWLLVAAAACVEAVNNSTSGGGEPQFLTEPNDVHKRVGQSVVMPCRVKNRNQGRVQWTRDGFGLGSSRTTDFPRYSVIGNDLDSKPNSFIFNAFCNFPRFKNQLSQQLLKTMSNSQSQLEMIHCLGYFWWIQNAYHSAIPDNQCRSKLPIKVIKV